MLASITPHPVASELQAYSQGRLAAEAAAAIEQHVATCDNCCRQIEEAPADSFLGQLRDADRAALGTTADAAGGTVTEAPSVPAELADHPRYRVLGLIGQGGMGAVYKAEHRRMQRLVALKIINPGLMAKAATVERFQQEVRAAARLHHPNIVTAHDADQAGGLHFLVMEYVEGRSLAELVSERGPLPTAEACAYVRQAAMGLQHAHEQGMVHRDVKPHNLMRTPDGTVKILDFGLARVAPTSDELVSACPDTPTGITGAGAVMGTADYVAPEQATDPRSADSRADIYSLGCTLFHLLTGRPPFPDGSVPEKIARHAASPLPPLTGAPAGLAAVVARMTAKEPANRYATPAEVAEALMPFAKADDPRPRRSRKRLLLAVALALAAGLLAVAGIVLRVQTERGEIIVKTDDKLLELTVRDGGRIVRIRDPIANESWDVNAKDYQIAVADRPGGLIIELPGKGTITLRRRNGGTVTVTTGPKGVPNPESPERPKSPTAEELAQWPNAADGLKHEDVPEEARAYVAGGDPRKAPPELIAVLGDTRFRCPHGTGRPAYSPDGKLLAVPGEQVQLFDAKSGRYLRSFKSSLGPVRRVVFSPDQKTIGVLSTKGKPEILDLSTGRQVWKTQQSKLPKVNGIAFSPDGKLLALGGFRKVEVWETSTGKVKHFWHGLQGNELRASELAFSPDGKKLVLSGDYFFSYLCDLENNPQPKDLDICASCVAFSPDGKYLALANAADGRVYFRNGDGTFLRILSAPTIQHVAFSPDGKTLLGVGWNGGSRVLFRWNAAQGKELGRLPLSGLFGDHLHYAFSPDGKTLAVTRDGECRVRLFDSGTGAARGAEPGHHTALTALAWSPDGQKVATTDASGTLILWDLAARRSMSGPHPQRRDICQVVFSPDGQLVILVEESDRFRVGFYGATDLAYRGGFTEHRRGQAFRAIAVSPDSKTIATAGADDTVSLWDLATGREKHILPTRGLVSSLAFSPDSEEIMAGTFNGRVTRWRVKDGKEIAGWQRSVEDGVINHVEYLNGQEFGILRTATSGGMTWPQYLVLDGSFKEPRILRNGSKAAKGNGNRFLNASPASRVVAFADPKHNLVLWQPTAKKTSRHFFDGYLSPAVAAFSPDGRYLACGSPDATVSLLRLAERGQVPELRLPEKEDLNAR